MESLRQRLLSGRAVVAGVLSGTSADGIDVGLVRFRPDGSPGGRAGETLGQPELVAFETVDYEAPLRARLELAFSGEPLSWGEHALLSRDLGLSFGRAVRTVARASSIAVELVASHGQTVYHHDGGSRAARASLQLGDGDWIAEEAGCCVVSDFRQRDLAAGGEGAPLSPLADDVLFARSPRPLAVLNLGGMANWTVLREDCAPLGFDTGPACRLLDALAERLLGERRDEGGAVAAGGRVSTDWLAELARHPFLEQEPPKSTGRDTFGAEWLEAVLARAGELGVRRPADLLASAVEFIASTAFEALERFAPGPLERIVVCGGGVHHAPLFATLGARAGAPLVRGDDEGVPADAREALVFAVLGARCVLAEPSSEPAVTGASAGRVLGKISPPTRALQP